MTRAQCIVHKGNRLLMVRHQDGGKTWWCLPGGGVEAEETPAAAALRELQEECCVRGVIIRQTSLVTSAADETVTFLVDIGEQTPVMGSDPEFQAAEQVLVEIRWLTLDQIPERDRAFLWSAGLLGIAEFMTEVSSWGDKLSYPDKLF